MDLISCNFEVNKKAFGYHRNLCIILYKYTTVSTASIVSIVKYRELRVSRVESIKSINRHKPSNTSPAISNEAINQQRKHYVKYKHQQG